MPASPLCASQLSDSPSDTQLVASRQPAGGYATRTEGQSSISAPNLIAQVAFQHKSSQGSAHGAGSSDSSQTERVPPAGMVLRALLHKNHAALQWLSQQ